MPGKLGVIVEAYLEKRLTRSTANRRWASQASVLRRLAEEFDTTRQSPKKLTAVFIEDWFDTLEVRPGVSLKPGSILAYSSTIRVFLEWACPRYDIPAKANTFDVQVSKTQKQGGGVVHMWLPAEFFQDAIENEDNWYWRGILATLTYTLGRQLELRNLRFADLRLGDIIPGEGRIMWRRTKTGDMNDSMPVYVELHHELVRYVAAYEKQLQKQFGPERRIRDSDYLFPRYRRYGKHQTEMVYPNERRDDLTSPIKRLIEKNLPEGHLEENPGLMQGEGTHTIRRSMARALYQKLVNEGLVNAMQVVQGMLGHTTQTMTERYIGMDAVRQARDRAVVGASFFSAPAAAASVVELRPREAANA